jgi:hypothetical protein
MGGKMIPVNVPQDPDESQKIKDALIAFVLLSKDMEKQNNTLVATIKKIVDDLKEVKTIEQLTALRTTYGISIEEKVS